MIDRRGQWIVTWEAPEHRQGRRFVTSRLVGGFLELIIAWEGLWMVTFLLPGVFLALSAPPWELIIRRATKPKGVLDVPFPLGS